ncbi:MAG: hypothetical protein ACLQF2_11735, partial [Rhodomicrobium sp.]
MNTYRICGSYEIRLNASRRFVVIPERRPSRRIYRVCGQAIFAWLQGVPVRSMALRVTISLRMT